MSADLQNDTFISDAHVGLAVLRHPGLEQLLVSVCAQLSIAQAYLAALRDPLQGQKVRLLLALSGSDTSSQRRLAAVVADWLPEDLEMDLIELEDDSLSQAVRVQCEPFYSR